MAKIAGPLGLWGWPLFNFLLERLQSRKKFFSFEGGMLQNEEVIIWVDWEGKERKTVIHRKVR